MTAFVQVGGPGVVEKIGGEAEDRGNEGEHIPLAKWEPTTITSISRGYNHILGRISWNGQKGFVSVVGFLSRRSNHFSHQGYRRVTKLLPLGGVARFRW